MEAKPEPFTLELCKHCSVNPKAEKPYHRMRELPLTQLTQKLIKKASEDFSWPERCVICHSADRLMKLVEAKGE